MDDEIFYEQVAAEIAEGHTRPGLWAKAFAASRGDEAATRAYYIRLRAQQLIQEAKAIAAAAAAAAKAEAALVEHRAEEERRARRRLRRKRMTWGVALLVLAVVLGSSGGAAGPAAVVAFLALLAFAFAFPPSKNL